MSTEQNGSKAGTSSPERLGSTIFKETEMNELQIEELKACVFSVGIASASDWVFRAFMLGFTLCAILTVALIRKKQKLDKELEELLKSNTEGQTRGGGRVV